MKVLDTLKILHINTWDIQGGAARAAYRLHRGLLTENMDSQMLVQSKSSDDHTVMGPETKIQKVVGKIRPILDALPVGLYKNRTKTSFSPSWLPFSNIVYKINQINPDIVHFHWIAGGMIRIKDIAQIKVPIVWSLHDMWAFTGGCHYDEECGKYINNCGKCKVLGSNNKNDLSRKTFQIKEKIYAKSVKLTIVGLTRWLAECARNSMLLKGMNIVNLPNPIDANIFKPLDKNIARDILSLQKDKKIILYGAMSATSDPRKGFRQFMEVITNLKSKDIELVVFGGGKPLNAPKAQYKTRYMGRLFDDVSLQVLYSAADVMVVPSLQEAFGQTATESMACGTPVVAFGITGLLDIVDHLSNGYLAKPFDALDMAKGIEWVINNKDYKQLSAKAREKVLKEFDSKVVAKKYIKLYDDILRKK